MTRSQCKEMLPTLQRWCDGETLQCDGETLQLGPKNWEDVDEDEHVAFIHPPNHYRIKPKPRVIWVSVDEDGDVGAAYSEEEHERASGKQHRRKFIEVIE